jgi:hypothetical protein
MKPKKSYILNTLYSIKEDKRSLQSFILKKETLQDERETKKGNSLHI